MADPRIDDPSLVSNIEPVDNPLGEAPAPVRSELSAADLSDEFDANYTISNVKIVAVDGTLQPLGDSGIAPTPAVGMAQTGVLSTTSATFNYIASADVSLSTSTKSVVARVRRVFSKQQLSPWNFAIFYVDPLEIHPGPPFTVTGWVNTNSNLYTAHSTLTFADKVTYASDWFINFRTVRPKR